VDVAEEGRKKAMLAAALSLVDDFLMHQRVLWALKAVLNTS